HQQQPELRPAQGRACVYRLAEHHIRHEVIQVACVGVGVSLTELADSPTGERLDEDIPEVTEGVWHGPGGARCSVLRSHLNQPADGGLCRPQILTYRALPDDR